MADYKIPRNFAMAEFQEFSNYEQGDNFLRDFCVKCAKDSDDDNKTCRINRGLREAMGENYPFWNVALVKIVPQDYNQGLVARVECKRFKSKS